MMNLWQHIHVYLHKHPSPFGACLLSRLIRLNLCTFNESRCLFGGSRVSRLDIMNMGHFQKDGCSIVKMSAVSMVLDRGNTSHYDGSD